MKPFYYRSVSRYLLCLALTLTARAADNTPTVDSILDKSVEASGGKTALEKIKSRTIKGDLDIFGSTSDWMMIAKAPNKQFSEFSNPTFGAVASGFDGTVAWSKNQAGIQVKEGEELAKMKRDADLYRDLHLKTLYPGLAYKGKDKVDDEEVHVLESKPSASSKERLSFSASSGLLVRQESEFEGPQGKVGVEVRLNDFRVVDGIKYPHSLKFKIGGGGGELEFGIKVKELKHNVAIDDAKFAKPAS
jgi:zinc protease